ncbi:hypothetical protein ID866_4753 [Astraeus odoratus]|nr:hypothetical protein ID866_4753 [Astraeus odoratus]
MLAHFHSSRILFLGYPSGLQAWDCTHLGSVSEVLNLADPSWGRVLFASVLVPPPPANDAQFMNLRPLIGVISRTHGESFMFIYSLRSHQVVKRLPFRGVSSFVSGPHLTVIDPDQPLTEDLIPVFALSHRLLAFVSPPPRLDAAHRPGPASQPRTHDRSASLTFGLSQAELGSTAVKVGGTVLNGMKSLGGMALNAAAEYARSRVAATPSSGIAPKPAQPSAATSAGVSNLFFSRSAPASGDRDRGKADPSGSQAWDESPPQDQASADTWWAPRRGAGSYVRVLDLAPLLDSKTSTPPVLVAEFIAAKHQPISHLKFAHDGNSLLVAPKDGQVIRVFQIRPVPRIARYGEGMAKAEIEAGLPTESTPSSNMEDHAPWHVYNLRRGRTSAVIEDIDISSDGRWVAVGTGKRTVHIFAVNPYGGHPDPRSHTDTRIWNADKPQPLSTELFPIARLRSTRPTAPVARHSDISFIFISSDVILSGNLLPPPGVASSPSNSSGRSDLGSTPHQTRLRNYKDVLLLDSSSGVLSLRRITLEQQPRESGISVPIASLATSISLPGAGASGRLRGSSPTHADKDARKTSGLTQQLLAASMELVGKESTVATWQLRRRRDWREVKHVLYESGEKEEASISDSLAHAELSTFSRHAEIVPRSMYLSHQFLFYTLGEDYHALIRRHHLGITGDRITVRREVEPNAQMGITSPNESTGLGRGNDELFVTGTPGGPDPHRTASSLDEPLANAMTSGLDAPAVVPRIPMFPNGTPGRPRSFGSALPIKSLKEGVGEGLGKLRREIYRVRSPKCEHEQEGQIVRNCLGSDRAGDSGGSGISGATGVSLSTPPTGTDILAASGDPGVLGTIVGLDEGESDQENVKGAWQGWDWAEEDKRAIDEAEQFDDVLGFMDEDQHMPLAAQKTERQQHW